MSRGVTSSPSHARNSDARRSLPSRDGWMDDVTFENCLVARSLLLKLSFITDASCERGVNTSPSRSERIARNLHAAVNFSNFRQLPRGLLPLLLTLKNKVCLSDAILRYSDTNFLDIDRRAWTIWWLSSRKKLHFSNWNNRFPLLSRLRTFSSFSFCSTIRFNLIRPGDIFCRGELSSLLTLEVHASRYDHWILNLSRMTYS